MLKLTVTSIDTVHYAGDVDSVTVPGREGVMTILPHHAPLITPLLSGEIIIRVKGKEEKFVVSQGFLDIGKGETVILTE
jgi:F-type H+-transporting ATPase subunit epsilon